MRRNSSYAMHLSAHPPWRALRGVAKDARSVPNHRGRRATAGAPTAADCFPSVPSPRTPPTPGRRPRGLRLSLRTVGTDFAAEGLLDGLEGERARGAPGAARAAGRRGRLARGPARRQPRRAAAVRRRRARDGRPAALLDARGRRARRRSRRSSSWPCAARRGCRCPTPTPSLLGRRRRGGADRARLPGGRGSARSSSSRSCACSAAGWPRRPRRMRATVLELVLEPGAERGRADAALRRARRRLHAAHRPDDRVHAAPAPAPVGAHRGDQRRRAPGGRAARARARSRSASPTSSASRAWASRSRPRSSARSPTAWSTSPPSACAAPCAWSRRSATR